MRHNFLAALVPLALSVMPQQAHALCAPTRVFGVLADATFGGSGISNQNVVQAWCVTSNVIALSATPRYSSPLLTNDGVDTFFASAGFDSHAPGTYAEWNFDFYTSGSDYYSLFMDTDPTDAQSFLRYDFAGPNQDSWNIGMGFYGGDPTVDGDYSYEIMEFSDPERTHHIAEVDMDVIVSGETTTPEPASLVLLGTGLLAVAGAARRRRHADLRFPGNPR